MVRSLARFLSKLARPAVRRLARYAAIARTADVLATRDELVLFAFFPDPGQLAQVGVAGRLVAIETCWMPLHDVDEHNGCMHFIDRGHLDGVLMHRQPDHIRSDLLYCEPDLARTVACPIRAGSVTFHHGKAPHMTPSNSSDDWRRAVTTHMRVTGTLGEGDHYPWNVYLNQMTGERTIPPSR
jgi:ectoine hydroxylase-related dioxygenase (phytanoyl-CoA dioxygenase family)